MLYFGYFYDLIAIETCLSIFRQETDGVMVRKGEWKLDIENKCDYLNVEAQ